MKSTALDTTPKHALFIEQASQSLDSAIVYTTKACTFEELRDIDDKVRLTEILLREQRISSAMLDQIETLRSKLRACAAASQQRKYDLSAKTTDAEVPHVAKVLNVPMAEVIRMRKISEIPRGQREAVIDIQAKKGVAVTSKQLEPLAKASDTERAAVIKILPKAKTIHEALEKARVVPDWTPSKTAAPASPVEVANPKTVEYVRLARELRTKVDLVIAAAAKHLRAPSAANAQAVIDSEVAAAEAFRAMRRNGVH